MGDSKLCLLLLLSTSALAFAQDEDVQEPTCPLAQRYKTMHKYEYQYEAESLNSINGGSLLKNGPKGSCKVEVEVPQSCSYIIRTTGCSLSEVQGMDEEGNTVFRPVAGSDAFAAEMEKYTVKVTVDEEYNVSVFPDDGESQTILNIKKGIVSALAVPLVEEDKNKRMPTIHGKCRTYSTVNAREDIATDITLKRDLSGCDKFVPVKDHTSPLALISGLHSPLAQLVRSSQNCNYKFDNEQKHMTSATCTEHHILIPFSYKGQYGVTNVGKQALTLVEVSALNDRVFEHGDVATGLHMDAVTDKSAIQDKEVGLDILRKLANLPETEGEKRAHYAHLLVSMIREMNAETLNSAIPEAMEISPILSYQALAQCGTPECSSAIMQILRTMDSSSVQVDTAVFAMGVMSNPSPLLIHDLLEMAKFKPSKPILYALSNTVKRFYKAEGKLVPEINAVAEFMGSKLGDCSGDQDETFLYLRVIGNMAPAMSAVSPPLRAAVIGCVNKPEATLEVQEAAIQAFRLIPVPEEGREILMQVLLDGASPLQKRVAAYLVLMRDPQPSELRQLADALPIEEDQQAKSFVISHITNILSSKDPATEELRQKILDALQGNEIGATMDPTKFSRNYKFGSLEGNMIFDGSSYLPKEVMLEMTLKSFGFDIDMMEFGMEGKGFEPTAEALFGLNGFFPDTTLKTMYFVSENMPQPLSEVLQTIVPSLKKDEMKKQATKEFMRELGHNLNKLMTDLKAAQTPEAMVYMKLLGNELGYLKTSDIEEMAYSAVMMMDSMMKLFPGDLMKALMSKTDNAIYVHYIFLDNEFFLPTATGVPLRLALSGTFAPGVQGGLLVGSSASEFAFKPSFDIDFKTRAGSFIPEYVHSGLEMHTNLFHESGLAAKVTMERGSVKLTIPTPASPMKFLKMTNRLVALAGADVMTIPAVVTDKVDVNECTLAFSGMKYCYALQYTDAFSQEATPYFPFTGDSKLAVELHPAGDVTEYTATIAYELLREGEEGKQKVDAIKVLLRAESADPTEASVTLKYNRRRNFFTADMQIPDMDFDAGLRLGAVDDNKEHGTHSVSLDLVNKNIPQASLIGRAKMADNKEAMLQVQLLVPALSTDATVTAHMKREDALEVELKSEIKIMDATSVQEIDMKYDATKFEVALKSDVNVEKTILPKSEAIEASINQLLDAQFGETEIKVRDVFHKTVETANNYMEKYGADLPYIQNLRIPEMGVISVPEKVFLNAETHLLYFFNNERFTIAIPLPLGGKSTEELNFPPALTTPSLSLPQFGLEIVSMEIPLPEIIVPKRLALSIPLFGKAEVSTLLKSNLYDAEATVVVGKDDAAPGYLAKVDVKGTSPIDALSVKIEGSGLLTTTDSIKAELKTALVHKLLEASVIVSEELTIADKINLKSISKIDASSPLGLNIALEHTCLTGLNTEEISADSNLEGTVKAGPLSGKATSAQTFSIFPFRQEAKLDSSVQIESTVMVAENTVAASLANGEMSIVSNTKAFEDLLTHTAELSYKENKLSLKCDANALAYGMKIHNQAEASAGAGEVALKIETNTEQSENRIYSLVTANLDANSLTVNSDATVKLLENEAVHKATLTMNKDGLTTSGSTTLQSPLSLENTFNFELDAAKASLAINNKAQLSEIKIDNPNTLVITLSSIDFTSKADAGVSDVASYTHDITVNIKPDTAAANVNNVLKLWAAEITNEAQLQAELYKVDLTGSLKATYGDEEIKHIYQVNYVDLSANAKCSTTGKILGTHMNQNTELEVVGLAARLTHDARFNSQPMRFDYNIRSSVVPFDFNLDAVFNADGDMTMYGKHSAQLYGKFLLRAQPLALASSHECRASVSQQLNSGFSMETTVDNKMETVLSLTEQKASLRLKSKMNENTFNHELSLYNTPERAGVEVSGTILTSIINVESADNQEYTIAGFIKYDKSTDCPTIQLPLVNLPALLENVRGLVISVAETLQSYINNEEMKAKLEALPQYVSDFVSQLNVDAKVEQLKLFFADLAQEFVFTQEDVETMLNNLKTTLEKLVADLTSYVQHYAGLVMDIVINGAIPDTLIANVQETLDAFMSEFEVKALLASVIDTVTDVIQKIDLEKLKGSSVAFLVDLDTQYQIRAVLQTLLSNIKEMIMNYNLQQFITEVKTMISSLKIQAHIEELLTLLPTEIITDVTNYVNKVILDLDIVGKINGFFAKLRELIVKFDLQTLMQNLMDLVSQYKVEETVRAFVTVVKDADIPTKFINMFQAAIDYLKATEIKDIIEQLNQYLETTVQKLTTLNYNDAVEIVNNCITEVNAYLNTVLTTLEIPQKFAATKDFVNVALSTIRSFMESLREIKVAEVVKAVKDVTDEVVLKNLKTVAEFVKVQVTNLDIKGLLTYYLDFVRNFYTTSVTMITDAFTNVVELLKTFLPEQKIIGELQQIANGLIEELKKAELATPSFTIPFTTLVVPSKMFSVDALAELEIPTQLDLPEFTILGFHTVPAMTVSIDEIKTKIAEIIELILSFEIVLPDVDAFFGELTLSSLPPFPELSLPDITLPELTLPLLPQVPVEKLVQSLELPQTRLPTIPSEILFPCLGKLSGEFKVITPIYGVKTSAEILNSTEDDASPQLSGLISSQATSTLFESLNYKLDSTAQIAFPKRSRILVSESVKFEHLLVVADHQASVTLYGLSGQAQAKTTVKVATAPYTAEIMNTAFIGLEEGMTATLDTTYTHEVNMPLFNVMSEATLTQKAIARQDGLKITVTGENSGTGKINAEDVNHKSNLEMTLTPSLVTLTFSGDTDSAILKMKQQASAEMGTFSYMKATVRNEAEGLFVKNSVFAASLNANFYDLKAELKINHDTELFGSISGVLSNGIVLVVRPVEVVFEFQNKGNAKVDLFETLSAKIDLQNDYSANLRPDSQQVNTVALVRLNQYKAFYNVTVNNDKDEAAILFAFDGEANLDFLTAPISIPEFYLPIVEFRTPGISDLNLYEQTGLNNILTTTEQAIDLDAKVAYQKRMGAPLLDVMGLVQIPHLGDLITELSLKSSIINLNANAALYTEDDIVFRMGATTASVFEALNAKLDGTTSLTIKRGIKLANSLSLQNQLVESTHESSISLNTETYEPAVSVITTAKIALPIISLEANQNLVANTKSKANAASTLRIKADFNVPMIKAVGKAEAEHSLKVEGTFEDVSVEVANKANMDGTVLEDYLILGVLDNDMSVFLNTDGLRSTLKVIADAKVNAGTDKLIGLDVNGNLAAEASLTKVYAVLKYAGNNEANLFGFTTTGKHIAQATVDIAPFSSMTADVEIDFAQPSNLGDLSVFEKVVAEVSGATQKISANGKFISPLYSNSLAAEVEGKLPVLTVTLKSAATCPMTVLLEYDLDASSTASLENEALNIVSKAILTHTDLTMNINHASNQALRRKRDADSTPGHTLNVDITSATFTDANVRLAASMDGLSASVSTPSMGYLALQFTGKVPDMTARLFGRSPADPEVDVDFLAIKSSPKGDDKMTLQVAYNMDAPKLLLSEIKTKLPAIASTITAFGDKYLITTRVEELKNAIVERISEAYAVATNYDEQMSQLSMFYRNIVVEYQKTMQVLLEAVVKILRETQFQLPGADEMTTIPEVLKKLTTSIGVMLDSTIQMIYANAEIYYNALIEKVSNIRLQMPVGDALSGGQLFDQIKATIKNVLDGVVDIVKNMESLDTMLEKIGETTKAIVEKTQEFVDSIKSDYLDAVFMYINNLYVEVFKFSKNAIETAYMYLDTEKLNNMFESLINMLISVMEEMNNTINGFVQQATEEAQSYVKVNEGRLELDLPFPFLK